jgi:diguanylate cyclase (GGDEF)-like protein
VGGKGLLFTTYVAFTTLAGTAMMALLVVGDRPGTGGFDQGAFWMLAAMAVAAELFPLRVPRGEREGELTVSTTCGFALLLVLGPAAAAAALAIASLVADVSHRKLPWKVVFNAAQYVLSVAAASVVVSVTGTWYTGTAPLALIDLLVALAAGAVFAAVNTLVMAGAVSVATRSGTAASAPVPILDVLRGDAPFLAWSYTVLVSLGPIVALTAMASLWAVPLFVVPAVAVYQSVSIYLDRKRHSLHDPLTNLPNRALFEDRVTQAAAGAQRTGTKAAVLVLDVDQFKEVNSTLGFEVGDRLLRDLASRLSSEVRDVDTIARLGADEFGVVLVGISDIDAAESVVAALREAITRPFVVGDVTLAVEASVGGALCPDDGVEATGLISAADDAMGEAKRLRLGRRWHASAQQGQLAGRMRLLAELRSALDAGDLELHYQPKASLRTGEISGVEALVRWRRHGGELVAPSEFVPVAEQTGLMAKLTRYVLAQAIGQMRMWHDAGRDIRVAVNISARDLHDQLLPDDIARMLSANHIDPADLELEITESSIMADIDQAVTTLSRLHDMGMTLAIDDFGTGNTSLAQLPRLPVDVLKIDRSFVQRLDVGTDDLIVRTTIELGRGLGLEVVAEGVASSRTWQRLEEMGCDYAQGYYVSRPVPAHDVDLLIGHRVGR